jgi:integrase
LTRPDLLTDRFRRHVKRIGMDIHFHGLRHTQGTLLLSAGVPDRIAMARMRHRTKEMMHLYAHVLPPMRDGAAEQIDRALGRSRDAM